MNKKPILNNQIRFNTIRLVGDNIEPEVMSIEKARNIQRENNLDLLLISENTKPPVVKLCDYNKEVYKKQKIEKKNNNKGKNVLKEVRISPNISIGDLNTKKSKIEEFISKGNKVKLTMMFKGRMIHHKDIGEKTLLELLTDLEDIAKPDNLPKLVGKNMTVIISPKK